MNSNKKRIISYKGWLLPVLIVLMAACGLALDTSVARAETDSVSAAQAEIDGTEVTRVETLDAFIDQTAPDLEAADNLIVPDPDAGDDLSAFALMRVMVDLPLTSFYGAESAVEYEDQTVLTFATEADTKAGYEALRAELGAEHVLLDGLVSLDDEPAGEGDPGANADPDTTGDPAETRDSDGTGDPAETGALEQPSRFHGWGAEYMGLQYQLDRYENGTGEEGESAEGTVDGEPVTVAVLDSGIDIDHEIFDGVRLTESSRNFVAGADGKVDPENFEDDYVSERYGMTSDFKGHGTGICGIIAESLPKDQFELMVLKVASSKGTISLISMQEAFSYAMEHGADVINASFSGIYTRVQSTDMVEAVLAEMASQGVVTCVSSGNNRQDMDAPGVFQFPSESPNVICVGAINRDGNLYSLSNYGSSVDFAVPGSQLEMASTSGPSDYAISQGTSFSCPYVTAFAAYLKMDEGSHSMFSTRDLMIRLAGEHAKAGQIAQKPAHDPRFGYGVPAFAEDSVLGPAQPLGELTVNTAASYIYTGKARNPVPAVSFDGLATGAFDTEYLTDSTAIGPHKLKVTLRGCFTEAPAAFATYCIVPARPAVTKVKISRPKSKKKPAKVKVKWSKGQKYYQLQLSRKSSFSSKKTWKTTKRSRLVKGLKRGKTYYVRVRTGKAVGGVTYWSDWSKTRKLKVK
ncbi:MAG: S8/S53 family peptidase [Firmicutes bacterium]|nr:S8/S53 family peptidase [Bacillota bacterium]